MSGLQERIAGLPEWPPPITNFDIHVRDWGRWQHEGRLAALARLALARDVLMLVRPFVFGIERIKLIDGALAALEVPK